MSYEEVLIEMLQRNGALHSNTLHDVKCELKNLNSTLGIIAITLKRMSDCMTEAKKEEDITV